MSNEPSTLPAETNADGHNHNGRPKLISVGIAPLGVISIGVVPMGLVSIGVVPMGLLSLGVVSMGLLSCGLVCMGLGAIGVQTMGLFGISATPHLHQQPIEEVMPSDTMEESMPNHDRHEHLNHN